MTVETLPYQNHVVSNGDLASTNLNSAKKSKESERRRRRRKQKKKSQAPDASAAAAAANGDDSDAANDDGGNAKENADSQQVVEQVVIEYVPEKAELEDGMDEFRSIFEKFNFLQSAGSEENDKKDESIQNADAKKKTDSDSIQKKKIQRRKACQTRNKKKKLQRRMKIADLKQICSRPDVVEVWDATSADPKLLVFLKSYKNTVPVPRHWCQKRKFLQGKRGIEKQPFQLPDFIAATGIEKIRQAYIEKEDGKKLKQKQRERMQPKMGKMDIDYQVLHDAFFKYQTKPKLTTHGDLYHEGKEFEVKLREMKPGSLSHELKEALGMPEGAPPPWLINMQIWPSSIISTSKNSWT
uniref:PSP proline-rich domain-containing protein n=1 Tax=Salix viminalis TaxID=40686 RepID=A0A6N2KGZ8_SALVM